MFNYQTNAREHQDLFVLAMLNKKRAGTYLEIGGAHPIHGSNTYLLEASFNWLGVSIEWSGDLSALWAGVRSNPCICADATLIDYDQLLEKHQMDHHIDYLQLDIDPPCNTFKALLKINFFKYSFSVITYEHDLYNGGDFERLASRKILESHGYKRIISDVMHDDLCFEDWYINPKYIGENLFDKFQGEQIVMNPGNLDPRYANLLKICNM